MKTQREQWNTKFGFILASVGSAVGLGNIWRFPTMVVQNGGGAYVALFLLAVLLVGVPMLIVELTLGRKSQRNIVSTFMHLAPGSSWWIAGAIGLLAVVVILSFYSAIAGWILIYFIGSAMGVFSGLNAGELAEVYTGIVSNPVLPILGQGFFIAVTVLVVMTGVTKGIERWSKLLMPGIILLLFILLGRTLLLDGAAEGILWFLRPNLELMTVQNALGALGQVFFSFSLGMGAILTYGSYLSKKENIPQSAMFIGLFDVAIAILMGLIVAPAFLIFNVQPEVGPGVIFITLPSIFNTIPGGILWATLFFLMVAFAALTSSVSMIEVGVAYFLDKKGWSRRNATILFGLVIFLVGIPSTLSQGLWSDFRIFGRTILDFMDFTASSILLPVGGLLTVVFLGWIWGTDKAVRELNQGPHTFHWERQWSFVVRYIIPAAILYVFVTGII